MKLRKIVTYILYGISLISILLASGIKQVANWWDIAKPYFIVWFICLVVGLVIGNINYIRRYTYPAVICLLAWLYGKKIINTKFSKSTYQVYRYYGKSYGKLFTKVKEAFDYYMISEV